MVLIRHFLQILVILMQSIASVEVLSCISSCPSESLPFLHFCEAIILQTADSISRLV